MRHSFPPSSPPHPQNANAHTPETRDYNGADAIDGNAMREPAQEASRSAQAWLYPSVAARSTTGPDVMLHFALKCACEFRPEV